MARAALRVFIATALVSVAAAAVTVLTPDNFDSVVGGANGVFVKFYAPWCGHCKSMAADYETVSEIFKPGDGVVVAEYDADAHREFATKFGIKGFPTLKWFPKGASEPVDYQGGRGVDDIVSYINSQTGLNRRQAKAPSAVVDLTSANFDAIMADSSKHRLVEFYAPWCGHCKALAPVYEKVASAFEGESNVVVAKVDADKYRDLGSRFKVEGFPTIKYFPAGAEGNLEDIVQEYNSGRDGESFVNFLNEKAGTERTLSGSLQPTAGRLAQFDDFAKDFMSAEDKTSVLEAAKEAAAELTDAAKAKAEAYLKVMAKALEKGEAWVKKEAKRLAGLLSSDSIAKSKKTDLSLRKNVLAAFEA